MKLVDKFYDYRKDVIADTIDDDYDVLMYKIKQRQNKTKNIIEFIALESFKREIKKLNSQ